MRRHWISLFTAGVMASTAATAFAGNDDKPITADEIRQLREEIAELRGVKDNFNRLQDEVRELRGEREQNWLSERRAEEVKSLVREVLDDADTRASMMADGMYAGHDGKFFLASADGTFRLNLEAQAQIRYIYNMRDRAAAGSDGDLSGFQMRRGKLKFNGHVGDPKFKYAITLASSRGDNEVYLEELKLSHKITDDITVVFGRAKAPFLREELTSSSRQLAVERSSINETFTLGWTEGAGITYDMNDNVILNLWFSDGAGSGEHRSGATAAVAGLNGPDGIPGTADDPAAISAPVGASGANDFAGDMVDYAFTARADVMLAGDWSQMKDFSSARDEDTGIFVGAAVHYEHSETGGGALPFDEFVQWTVDGSYECQGLSLYGAIIGSHFYASRDGGTGNMSNYGYLMQAAYNINDHLEPYIRYEMLDGDDPFVNDVSLITVGANYYMRGHKAKFTADLVWGLDPLRGGISTSSGLGLRTDDAGQDDQIALRMQYQLLY